MSAIFVRPMPFTAATTSPAPLAGSVVRLGNDQPNLMWRFGLTGAYLIIDLGAAPSAYQFVGLFGANFRATDTVQIRTGTTTTGIGAYAGTAQAAFTGTKDPTSTTTSIFRLPTARSERYMRIDLAAPSHPDGYVEFARLVVGAPIDTGGLGFGAEHSFEGQSVVTTGPGYRSVDPYPTLDAWKISTDWIDETPWRTVWAPMLRYAAAGNGVMFIPNDETPATWQSDALFGFMTSTATGKWEAANKVRFETKLIAFSR